MPENIQSFVCAKTNNTHKNDHFNLPHWTTIIILVVNLLHGRVPIRMLWPGVWDGVARAGVGVMHSKGEYIFTSRLACRWRFLCDELGVLPAELNGDNAPFVRRLCPRAGSLTFYKHYIQYEWQPVSHYSKTHSKPDNVWKTFQIKYFALQNDTKTL